MNKRIKGLWVKALRSPYAVQTVGKLCDPKEGGGFCCLGVLCQIHAEETGAGAFDSNGCYIVAGDENEYDGTLPLQVMNWADINNPGYGDFEVRVDGEKRSGSDLNDNLGWNFQKIADKIEKKL